MQNKVIKLELNLKKKNRKQDLKVYLKVDIFGHSNLALTQPSLYTL